MKIDRLIGIIMYLLNRNVVTAKELAERFGFFCQRTFFDTRNKISKRI